MKGATPREFTRRSSGRGTGDTSADDAGAMRVALVTESFYPAVDGTTTTVKAVADRLVDTGHEVTLLAPGPGLSSYRGSRVVRSRHLDPSGSQVREALTDVRPDLVHVASPGPLGRKVLKHAHRLGVATVVVEQSAVQARLVRPRRPGMAGKDPQDDVCINRRRVRRIPYAWPADCRLRSIFP